MVPGNYRDKQLLLVRKWLEKWNGGTARLWEYSVSHKTLVIRMTSPDKTGNLHICCGDVSYIACPTEWEGVELQLEAKSLEKENHYRLIDQVRGYYLACGVVEAKENVKPI